MSEGWLFSIGGEVVEAGGDVGMSACWVASVLRDRSGGGGVGEAGAEKEVSKWVGWVGGASLRVGADMITSCNEEEGCTEGVVSKRVSSSMKTSLETKICLVEGR